MKQLEKREKLTIGAGALVVAVVLGWKLLAGGPELGPRAGSLDAMLQETERLVALRETVADRADALTIELPGQPAPAQEATLRQDLRQRAGKQKLAVASMRKIDTTRRRGDEETIRLQLEMSGKFVPLMTFIHQLETAAIPYAVRDLKVDAVIKGKAQGDKPPPMTGDIKATLQVESWLFPVLAKEPEAAAEGKPEAEETTQPDTEAKKQDEATTGSEDGPSTATATPHGEADDAQ